MNFLSFHVTIIMLFDTWEHSLAIFRKEGNNPMKKANVVTMLLVTAGISCLVGNYYSHVLPIRQELGRICPGFFINTIPGHNKYAKVKRD